MSLSTRARLAVDPDRLGAHLRNGSATTTRSASDQEAQGVREPDEPAEVPGVREPDEPTEPTEPPGVREPDEPTEPPGVREPDAAD